MSLSAIEETKAGATPKDMFATHGRCPFLHGSVYTDPFPGYVMGRQPAICEHGCVPAPGVGVGDDHFKERLKREARDYARLFYKEMGMSQNVWSARQAEIEASIDKTGTYEQTFDEMQHGARVGWRNAAKCINRQACMLLELIDCRKITDNQGMFDACVEHLRQAAAGPSLKAMISLFKPTPPSYYNSTGAPMAVGPRYWNNQLLRFAGHTMPDGTILGDPAEVEFTTLLKTVYGWKPPTVTRFDIMPILCQMVPDTKPELFELPKDVINIVDIVHPRVTGMQELGLKWYAIPLISNMDLSLGGLIYTASPFNGWYMCAEVATRNFADAHRFDMLPHVARILGLDTRNPVTMWKEHALAVLNESVAFSYAAVGASLANHHVLSEEFFEWQAQERKERGYTPINWKWIIPPTAGSTSPMYLQGNKWTEYTLFPQYYASPKWKIYMKSIEHLMGVTVDKVSRQRLDSEADAVGPSLSIKSSKSLKSGQGYRTCNAVKNAKFRQTLVLYGSAAGSTKQRANQVVKWLKKIGVHGVALDLSVYFKTGAALKGTSFSILSADLETVGSVIFLTSTTGSGDMPPGTSEFVNLLLGEIEDPDKSEDLAIARVMSENDESVTASDNVRSQLSAMPIAVLSRGNKSYSRFARGGEELHKALKAFTAPVAEMVELVPYTATDELRDEDGDFHKWLAQIVGQVGIRANVTARSDKIVAQLLESASFSTTETHWKANGVHRSFLEDRTSTQSADAIFGIVETSENVVESQWVHTTHLVTFDLTRAMTRHAAHFCSYKPGDHCKIFAKNPAQMVAQVTLHLGVHETTVFDLDSVEKKDDDAVIVQDFGNAALSSHLVDVALRETASTTPFPVPTTVWLALRSHITLCAEPTPQLLRSLATVAGLAREDKEEMLRLANDSVVLEKWVKSGAVRITDLFDHFPTMSAVTSNKINGYDVLSALCTHAADMKPRFYSIASSSAYEPGKLRLLLSRVAWRSEHGLTRLGFASGFLAEALPGTAVHIELQECRSFHLPDDNETPILMIAAGTGMAPFRGFLAERISRRYKGNLLGRATMLFGCRDEGGELCRDLVNKSLMCSALTRYEAAHSRVKGEPKQYVQDRLRSKPDIFKEIADIGHVYICGDANMAVAVQTVVEGIAKDQDIVRKLKAQGRWHEDVFGSVLPAK